MIKRMFLKAILVLLFTAYVLSAVLSIRPVRPARRGAFMSDRILNIAHRGGALEAPENTLVAFAKALQSGANALELDVWMSADGVLFVLHDETVDRTTDGRGLLSAQTRTEIERLDAAFRWNPENLPAPPLRGIGVTIPSLEEVFRSFPEIPMIVELKTQEPEAVDGLGKLLEKYDRWDSVIMASFHQGTVKKMRERFPEALTSAGRNEVKRFYLLHWAGLGGLARSPAHSFQIPERSGVFDLLSRRMLRALRRRGMDVYVWTVDEEPDMRRIMDRGVQGIITDRPSVLARVLEQGAPRERKFRQDHPD